MPFDLIIERISDATIGFSNLPLTRIVIYASGEREGEGEEEGGRERLGCERDCYFG